MKVAYLLALALLFAVVLEVASLEGDRSALAAQESRLSNGRCAIVTYLYQGYGHGESFALGAAVLGYSLQASKTRMDMIAMVTEHVHLDDRFLLESAGWKLHEAHAVKNPNQRYFARLEYAFTKLQIFTLVDYERVVFLDADMVAAENIDELCSCAAPYCTVVRNTFFNSGMLVIEPSMAEYEKMMSVIGTTHSYTGADQGFLNNYWWNTERCPFYEPQVDLPTFTSSDVPRADCYRLPGYYNGDVGLFVARGDRWEFNPDQSQGPKVIHYTMAFFKPWMWWTYFLVHNSWTWWDFLETHSQTSEARYFALFIQCLPIAVFWFACLVQYHRKGTLLLPFFFSCTHAHIFRVIGSSACLRTIFGQLLNLASFLIGFAYASYMLIQPTANFWLCIATYLTLFEIFCIQFWHHAKNCAAGMPDSPLPAFATRHRIFVFWTTCAAGRLLWGQSYNVYMRILAGVVWLVMTQTTGHTIYCQSIKIKDGEPKPH